MTMKLDIIKEELKNHVADFVKADAKAAFLLWLKHEVLPALRDVAAVYTAALRESAAKETGWCKFRDAVFLPCAVDGSLWLIGKALVFMAAKTERLQWPSRN